MAEAADSIEIASLSDVGLQRSENQDAFAERHSADGSRLLVVADGMGGHLGGATASRMAVDVIARCVEQRGSTAAPALLRAAFEEANRAIREAASADPALKDMGTTAVALLLEPSDTRVAWVAHVGDSRLYRLRGGQLESLTRDHSLRSEMLERTEMTSEEVDRLPAAHALLRALGSHASVEVEIADVRIEAGDVFLLCSDGLWGLLAPEAIVSVLEQYRPSEAARILIDEANRSGGSDNITVQIAAVAEAPAQAARPLIAAEPHATSRFSLSRTAQVVFAIASLGAGLALVGVRWLGSGEAAVRVASAPPLASPPPSVEAGALSPARAALRPLEGEIHGEEPLEPRLAKTRSAADPTPAPAPRASETVLSGIAAGIVEYERAVRSCDFDALSRIATRTAQRRARAQCAQGVAADVRVSVDQRSLRAVGRREFQVDVLEQQAHTQRPLQATLQSRPDGSFQLTELADHPRR
jgi:PPM family protein phosphatase